MQPEDKRWLRRRLDVALERAQTAAQAAAAIRDRLLPFQKYKLFKGTEPMDAEDIDRLATQVKEASTDLLLAMGSLHTAVTHCYPNKKAHAEGLVTVAHDESQHTTGPDHSAKGSPHG